LQQVAQAGLGAAVGFCARQWQVGDRAAHRDQLRLSATAQQRQARLDGIGHREQVAAQHAFDTGCLESARFDIFATAGIAQQHIQCTPVGIDGLGDGLYLALLAEVARQDQHLSGITFGKGLQRRLTSRAEGQACAPLEQLFSQCQADTTAGTGQPDPLFRPAHANLRFNQAISRPSSGRCSYSRAPASK